jgi:hypothetical protein
MKFDKLAQQILETVEGMNTSWEDEDGKIKVTIKDVIKYLDENDIPIKTIGLDKIKPIIIDQDYKNKNKNRVNASSLEYPIIVIKKNGKYKSILDGNHRAFKAVDSNAKNIKVREIDLSSSSTPDEYKELFDYGITPLY